MDGGMPANLTAAQKAQWLAQNQRIDTATEALQNLAIQAKHLEATLARNPTGQRLANAPVLPFDPATFARIVAETDAAYAPRNNPAPRIPEVTLTNLLIAAGITYTAAEARYAYDSFTAEEKANTGNLKLALLVALRTGKNILSRPAQLIGLPSKLFGSLEQKVRSN